MSNDPDTLKARHSAVWSRAATTYSHVGPRFFQHFGARLVSLAPIEPGSRVLDVAAGRGAALFPAAEKVGPQGEVVGIDYSEGMVGQTNAEIGACGLTNARMLHMDAEHLEFNDASFDCLICGFALFFFPNLSQALSEFHRVLKPGGHIAVSTWGSGDPRWSWLEKLGPRPTAGSVKFDDPEAMSSLIRDAGFTNINVVEAHLDIFFTDEEEWWATNWSHGVRITLENLTSGQLAQAKSYAHEKLQAMKQPQDIPLTQTALFTLATKPLP